MVRDYNPSLIEEGIGAVTIGANLIASPVTRRWYAAWGATDEEVAVTLPGDSEIPSPRLTTTRAITVSVPPAFVWPWLVQLGQGRGGLYTFQRLENLARCQIENVNEIRPELQDLEVGDKVRLGPEGYPFHYVRAIIPGQALVLGSHPAGETPEVTWVFYLAPHGAASTRLLARYRMTYAPTVANRLMWRGITDPIFFVMERRMLIGIRDRAEGTAGNVNPAHA